MVVNDNPSGAIECALGNRAIVNAIQMDQDFTELVDLDLVASSRHHCANGRAKTFVSFRGLRGDLHFQATVQLSSAPRIPV